MHPPRYSQASLQDFVDCRRRFFYRRNLNLNWPAANIETADDHEQKILAGEIFHTMIHQLLIGIPPNEINSMEIHPYVERWWTTFLNNIPVAKTGRMHPEFVLTTSIANSLLIAKYDLIHNVDEEYTIFDWKTSKTLPKEGVLRKRLQTRVYLFALASAGLPGSSTAIRPEKIKMTYWFSEHPHQAVTIRYSQEQKLLDETYLEDLISEISRLKLIDEFEKTDNRRLCNYCEFKVLCGRDGQTPENQIDDFGFESDAEFFLGEDEPSPES
ncbi:MAG: PD-(D/E)XK nuclease family protein [Anaerolineales bacterium]|nr:PD-(D/E)XK nuclease family protein [Anaerolineales bacterium]